MDANRLEAIPLFAQLTLDQRSTVADMCEEIEVGEGETLLREGDFGYSVFAVAFGTAEVVQGGKPIRALGPGVVFGEIAVLSAGRRTASVVATSPMRLVTVFNRDLWRLEQDVPEIATALRGKVSEHVGPPDGG